MELETLFAEPKEVSIGKTKVKINQVSLGDIPLLVRLWSRINPKGNLQEEVLKLSSDKESFEDIKSAIVSLTDVEKDKVEKINIAALLLIITEVMKENASFLQIHVIPRVKEMTAAMGGFDQSKS